MQLKWQMDQKETCCKKDGSFHCCHYYKAQIGELEETKKKKNENVILNSYDFLREEEQWSIAMRKENGRMLEVGYQRSNYGRIQQYN